MFPSAYHGGIINADLFCSERALQSCKCLSRFFSDFLNELSMRFLRNLCTPAISGRVLRCSMSPFRANDSYCCSLESQRLKNKRLCNPFLTGVFWTDFQKKKMMKKKVYLEHAMKFLLLTDLLLHKTIMNPNQKKFFMLRRSVLHVAGEVLLKMVWSNMAGNIQAWVTLV